MDAKEQKEDILYARNGRLFAHRIISISGEILVTRGDSLQSLDPPVAGSEVIGSVDGILRSGRAVDARSMAWQRAVAWMLRGSEIITKVYLRLIARRLQYTVRSETAQGDTA